MKQDNVAILKSNIHGLGLFSINFLNANTNLGNFFILEKFIKHKKDYSDINKYFKPNNFNIHKCFFKRNDIERYINHSDIPNTYCIYDKNNIWLYTKYNIIPGIELTIDYNLALKEIELLDLEIIKLF